MGLSTICLAAAWVFMAYAAYLNHRSSRRWERLARDWQRVAQTTRDAPRPPIPGPQDAPDGGVYNSGTKGP